MAFWVHHEVGPAHWISATEYSPPAPKPIGRLGYLYLCCEFQTETLVFSSREQLAEFIAVTSMKPMPTSKQLSSRRGTLAGPNQHWLSRLHPALKTAKVRERLVKDLSSLPSNAWAVAPNKPLKQRRAVKRRAA